MFKRIAVIGTGLIGGSIGIAARKARLAKEVVGIGRRKVSIRNAVRKGAIDRGTLDMKEGVEDADLIIVATPVEIVKDKIREAARYLKKGSVIIDVNSTKQDIVRYAEGILPKGVYFVGTHPVAGSEKTSVLNACGDIFFDTICIITPTQRTDKKALDKVKKFWERLGANAVFLSPAEHDRLVANISHLPHVISFGLCYALPPKDMKMAGSGLKDTTRIAGSNPRMWAEIFLQNRKGLLESIGNFEKALKSLKADIRLRKKKSLLKRLTIAKNKRDVIG